MHKEINPFLESTNNSCHLLQAPLSPHTSTQCSHSHRLGPLLTPPEIMITKGYTLSTLVPLLNVINIYIVPYDLNIIIPILRTGKYSG